MNRYCSLFFSYYGRRVSSVTILMAIKFVKVNANDNSKTMIKCGSDLCNSQDFHCCGDTCCLKKPRDAVGETWYFWVGIVASILLFLGFLALCICYLKKSLTATLTLVHNLPNDMVIIRTVQDPNGIIRPEVARPTQPPLFGKPPPFDASTTPEIRDSMLPLNPAYPPVRALEPNAMRRDSVHDVWRSSESQSLTDVSI